MAARQSEKIKLWGIVPGCRGSGLTWPRTAEALGIKGQVLQYRRAGGNNCHRYTVRISSFIEHIIADKPAPAEIVHIRREPVSFRDFDSFTIVTSAEGDDETAMLPADLAICPTASTSFTLKATRGISILFISCMKCGPRYTIIDKIPYDRHNTSMVDFPMCDFCENQYTDINDRRYHAQTISCHNCGPQLLWQENPAASSRRSFLTDKSLRADSGLQLNGDCEILDHAAKVLKSGGVIAFKGVGGYIWWQIPST